MEGVEAFDYSFLSAVLDGGEWCTSIRGKEPQCSLNRSLADTHTQPALFVQGQEKRCFVVPDGIRIPDHPYRSLSTS